MLIPLSWQPTDGQVSSCLCCNCGHLSDKLGHWQHRNTPLTSSGSTT